MVGRSSSKSSARSKSDLKKMEGVAPSHGSWSFHCGQTAMTYEGEFIVSKHDEDIKLKHGTGVMRWQDAREYRGQFAFDKMHGEGTMTWPTGEKYIGRYYKNLKGGFGKFVLPDGSSFEGNWYKGQRHGDFLYIDPAVGAFRMEFELDQVIKAEAIPSFEVDGSTRKPGYHIFIKSEGSEDLGDEEDPSCVICLSDLSAGETCCRMPCRHVFHKECIDGWTKRKNRCPLCMTKISWVYRCLSPPGEQPKSDVVHL